MSQEYVTVNIYRTEEAVEEIPQTSVIESEKKEDLRSKLLSMLDEALDLLGKIQPIPGVISEDELIKKRQEGRRLRSQVSQASDQDLSKLQPQVESFYYEIKALYDAYVKQSQASLDEQKRYGRKLIGDIRSFLSKVASLFNTDPMNKDLEDLSKKLEQANDISTIQSINHSLETLYNFSKDLSYFVDLYNTLPDDAKRSQDVKSLIDEVNKRISQKSYNINDLISKLNEIVKKSQEASERRKKIDELSKKLDDVWSRYQDLFMDPAERKPWVERYSKIKQMLDQALKDPNVDIKGIEDEINKFENDLKSLRESKLKAREENIRQLINRLDDAWNKVRGYLKDPELRIMLGRYQELKAKLEQALKDPSIDVIKLSQEVNSFISELDNIVKSYISTRKSEYEKEYNKFMSLYNSIRQYLVFPMIYLPPSPDQVSDYDKALRDLENYYNELIDNLRRSIQFTYQNKKLDLLAILKDFPYRDYVLSLLDDLYNQVINISRDNIDVSKIQSFYTAINNILARKTEFYSTLAFMNDSLRSQIESNIKDVLRQLGFKDEDASLFASSYVSSLSDVSKIYLNPQKSILLNYIALVYAAYNSGVISRDTFNSIMPQNILNIVLKMRQGQDITREEFNELVSWYAANKSSIDRIISILDQEASRNPLLYTQYSLSLNTLINGQSPSLSPIAVSRGILDDVLKSIGLISAVEWLNNQVNNLPIDPQMKWAINNVIIPSLIAGGLFAVSELLPGGQLIAGAIAVSSLGYMGSQFLDPVLRDQFLQAVSKDPNVLKDLVAQIGSAIVSGLIVGAVAGRSLSALGSRIKLQLLESLQKRLPVDSPLYKAISTMIDLRISDAYVIPMEREQLVFFAPRDDGSFMMIIKNVEKGIVKKVDSVNVDVFKFFGDLVKTSQGKQIISRIAEMIDKRGITSIELTSVKDAKVLIGSGDLHGFIIVKYGDKEIPVILDLEKPGYGEDIFNVYNMLRGFMTPKEIEDLVSKALRGVSYVKFSETSVEGKRIPITFMSTKDNKIVILTPLRSYEASPKDLLTLFMSREAFKQSGLPEGIIEEVFRLSLDSPYIKTLLEDELSKQLSQLKKAGQMTYSFQNWKGEKITIMLQNIDLEKSEILSILFSKTEAKPGLFSIIPSKYESKSFQVLEVRPKISMDIKTFFEKLGIKEGDFVNLESLRSKISGLIEEAAASGDQAMLSFLKELQTNLDTAIVSGMKPQMVITSDSSLTLIFSMNTGSETANAIVSKAQSMVKEVSQIKVLDQSTLNSLINKYGYLVSEYLNRFKVETVPKVEYVEKTSIISSSQYQEVIKPENFYDKKVIEIQLRPVVISRQIIQDQTKIVSENRYDEIVKPVQDYIRNVIDVYLRPVIISRQIIQDQRKIVPEAIYEEIIQPQRDYTRSVIDVQLRPIIVPRIIVHDQSKTITQEAYEEIMQPLKDYVRKTIDVELRPIVVSKSIVIDKTIPRELYEFQEVLRPVRDYVRQVSDVELKPVVVSKEEYVNQTVSQEQSTYNETIQPEKQEAKGIVTVEPVYTPVYAVNVKVTYVPPEEIGEPPVSISKGVAPAPPGMIPQGPQWREISIQRTEERKPEKEKVVL